MPYELSPPDQWLNLYGDILYRYGITRVRNAEIAEDLVQETLLAALKAQVNYAGKASEQTWLIGILKHKIIDYFRKVSREKIQVFDENSTIYDDKEKEDYFDEQGHWNVDFSNWSKPEKAMEQDEFLQILQQCIERLPERMGQLFILREFEDMKSEEICELLSISTMNNFWVMLSRVRVQLRGCLDINWVNQ
jgi:RNA polymerase sigma-70 factor (ECF subfamily)